MYFRTTYFVSGLDEAQGDVLVVPFDAGRVTVRLARRPDAKGRPAPSFAFEAVVQSRRSPTAVERAVFEALAARQIPTDARDAATWQTLLNADGVLDPDRAIPPALLPPAGEALVTAVEAEHARAARMAVALLQWRAGMHGDVPSTVSPGGREHWSLDGYRWHDIPGSITIGPFWAQPVPLLDADMEAKLAVVTGAVEAEPLGHSLWREAWGLNWSKPRAALVLAIAAAETGVKEMIADLVPQAAWWVGELPAPPLAKILKDGFIGLPAREAVFGHVLPLPKAVRATIGEAVTTRNSLVHAGAAALGPGDAHEVLLAVRDLLYLCDFYRGHRWAQEFIRPETRAELKTAARAARDAKPHQTAAGG